MSMTASPWAPSPPTSERCLTQALHERLAALAAADPAAQLRTYTPYGAAAELFQREDPELVVAGPAGTGKSRACLERLHLAARTFPGMRGLIARKTRHSLTQSALVTFEKQVLQPMDGVHFRTSEQEYRYPNGSVVVVGGLDKPTKVMSAEYDAIYVQEATELAENDWEALTTRLRNGKMPFQQLVADCNPDAATHWLKRRAETGHTVMLESRHEDNPTLWDRARQQWTATGAHYMAKLDALTGVRYLRLRLGIWAAAEGMVYEGWDEGLHRLDHVPVAPGVPVDARGVPLAWPRYWVVDFGFTHPFVWQAWAEDPDGRLYRYQEWYQTQRLVEDHARIILAVTQGEPRPQAIICDHDAEDRATLERHLNLTTIAAHKAVSPGLQAVAARLRPAGDGRPRLFFLRDALWERDPSLTEARKPTCTEDEVGGYCFVAGTMVMTAIGPRPIERIMPGTQVWTRQGLKPVSAAAMTHRMSPVFTATFSDGRHLTGTAEHPIWVDGKDWVSLSSLSSSDIIQVWQSSSSSSTASPIDAIPMGKLGQIACISEPSRQTVAGGIAACMLTSGSRFMGMFPPVVTSIIAMATRLTMLSTIWSVLPLASMLRHTGAIQYDGRRSGWPSWKRLVSCLPCGRGRLPGVRRPVNVAGRPGRLASLRNGLVSNAERHFRAAMREQFGSALGPAIRPIAQPAGSITPSDAVPCAIRPSKWIAGSIKLVVPVHVDSVIAEPFSAPVYNLTVEGSPEYYANGVLVHNCWNTAQGRRRGEEPVKQDDHGLDCTRYMVAHRDLVGVVQYGPSIWD